VVRKICDEDPEWVGVYLEAGRMLRTDPALRELWLRRNPELLTAVGEHLAARQAEGVYRSDLSVESIGGFLGVVLDGLAAQIGTGFPVDADGTLTLVQAALAPK
jgi:hypothetical protein